MRSTNAPSIEALDLVISTCTSAVAGGSPGTGKTSTVQALAAARNPHCNVVIASLREPTDLAGLPGGRCPRRLASHASVVELTADGDVIPRIECLLPALRLHSSIPSLKAPSSGPRTNDVDRARQGRSRYAEWMRREADAGAGGAGGALTPEVAA